MMSYTLDKISSKGEDWKPITPNGSHWISNQGRVYSELRKFLLTRQWLSGRFYVSIKSQGKRKSYHLKELIYETFGGAIPNEYFVKQKDGERENLRFDNLSLEKSVEDLIDEEWRPVTGYEGIYEVSSIGRVKSLNHYSECGRNFAEGSLNSQSPNQSGYKTVVLCRGGRGEQKTTHGIIAEAFIGKRKDGYVVDHKNNIKTDNRLENLQIITFRENVTKDAKRKVDLPHGVTEYRKTGRFTAMRKANGRGCYIGIYETAEEASKAYLETTAGMAEEILAKRAIKKGGV